MAVLKFIHTDCASTALPMLFFQCGWPIASFFYLRDAASALLAASVGACSLTRIDQEIVGVLPCGR